MKYNNNHYNRNLAFKRVYKNKLKEKMLIDLSLEVEDIGLLIRLLEFADFEISRNFKRFTSEDIGLKEIYYTYSYGCRRFRKLLQDKRGYWKNPTKFCGVI